MAEGIGQGEAGGRGNGNGSGGGFSHSQLLTVDLLLLATPLSPES
jgi:hypothetical protein